MHNPSTLKSSLAHLWSYAFFHRNANKICLLLTACFFGRYFQTFIGDSWVSTNYDFSFRLNPLLLKYWLNWSKIVSSKFDTWFTEIPRKSPTLPPIWSSGRQRKPSGPTLYCNDTNTWESKSIDNIWNVVQDKKSQIDDIIN